MRYSSRSINPLSPTSNGLHERPATASSARRSEKWRHGSVAFWRTRDGDDFGASEIAVRATLSSVATDTASEILLKSVISAKVSSGAARQAPEGERMATKPSAVSHTTATVPSSLINARPEGIEASLSYGGGPDVMQRFIGTPLSGSQSAGTGVTLPTLSKLVY